MTLIPRIRLSIAATALLGFAAALGVGLQSTRHALRESAVQQNRVAVRILASELTEAGGDSAATARLLLGRFDSGAYRSLRLGGPGGRDGFFRETATISRAPDWFARWSALEAPPVRALLATEAATGAWIEVAVSTAPLVDALWRSGLELAAALAVIGAFVIATATLVMRPLRRQLERAIGLAESLETGREPEVSDSDVPEIRRLGRALQGAARHVRQAFEAHAVQIDLMREETHRDPTTGLPNRARFLQHLETTLHAGARARAGGLVLLRLLDLEGLNRTIGHETADRAIQAIAQTLQAYTRRVDGCFVGRLNGSDFALSLPARGIALETAEAVLELLRAALPAYGSGVALVSGAVEVDGAVDVGALLQAADAAMTRAAERGPFFAEAGAVD